MSRLKPSIHPRRFRQRLHGFTIDISPMPLPMEMFCRKMLFDDVAVDRGDLGGGQPDSVLSRIAASALAETPDGFSTAK